MRLSPLVLAFLLCACAGTTAQPLAPAPEASVLAPRAVPSAPEAASPAPEAQIRGAARGAAGTQRALLVAINTYNPPGMTPVRRITDLQGPLNDLLLMQQVLVDRGVDPDHIETLTEEEATGEGIERAVTDWIEGADPGDHLTFFFAGHGSYADTLWVGPDGETEPRLETLVPADAASGAPDISDKTLRMWWNRALDAVTAGGAEGSLTIVQDNCHSGGGTRSAPGDPDPPRARQASVARAVTLPDAGAVGAPIAGRGALVIAATRPEQLAREDYVPPSVVGGEGGHYGVFTAAFVRALRAMPPGASPRDVVAATNGYVRALGFTQIASAYGSGPLFGEPTASGGVATTVVAAVERGGAVVLRGGLFAGLGAGDEDDPRDNATLVRTYTVDAQGRPLADSSVALRVERADATRSWATVTEGDIDTVKVGDRFRLTRSVPPPGDPLRLWAPEALADAVAYAPEGADLAPYAPAPEAVRDSLRGAVERYGAMEWVTDPALADYWLLGESAREGAERWVQPAELVGEAFLPLPRHLPARTGENRTRSSNGRLNVAALALAARRAADANYWGVTLQPPPGSREAFPVEILGLRRVSDGLVLRPDPDSGVLTLPADPPECEGEQGCYRIAVGLDSAAYAGYQTRTGRRQYARFGYLTMIDAQGSACLLLPFAGCTSNFDAEDFRLNVIDLDALEAASTADGATVHLIPIPDGVTWPFNLRDASNHGHVTLALLTTVDEYDGDARTLQWAAMHTNFRDPGFGIPSMPTWGLDRLHVHVVPGAGAAE